MSSHHVIPLGVGSPMFGDHEDAGGGRPPGGTVLVVAAAVAQLLGFAIPVVAMTTSETGPAYEFRWSYETFRLQSPGLAEVFFYLPVTGIVTLIAAFLPTRFLRPVLVTLIGAASLLLLCRDPELRSQLLARLPLFGWEADSAAALKAIALLAMAIGGGVLTTYAPRAVAVIAAIVAAVPALLYLGAPMPSEFAGGFAWKTRWAEIMADRPPEDVEAAWSVVTGYYILIAAFALDVLAIGTGAVAALATLRPAWDGAGRFLIRSVMVSLGTAALVVVGRAVQPLHDVTYEVGRFAGELTYNLKMLLATLGIVVMLPVGLIDLAGRWFDRRF